MRGSSGLGQLWHTIQNYLFPVLDDELGELEEKPAPPPPTAPQADPPAPQATRLQRQLQQPLADNLRELPRTCDWGTKRDSKGKRQTWRGYKLHVDVMDGDIPVSWLVTSANLHDGQAAIPLAQLSAARATSLYDWADAAYDAGAIRQMSARLGHVALIPRPSAFEPRKAPSVPRVRHASKRFCKWLVSIRPLVGPFSTLQDECRT